MTLRSRDSDYQNVFCDMYEIKINYLQSDARGYKISHWSDVVKAEKTHLICRLFRVLGVMGS